MPWIELPGGAHAHICMRGRRTKRCGFCNTGYVEKLCDFPINASGKTCDAGMCHRCATNKAPEVDYCPKHKDSVPPQASLF